MIFFSRRFEWRGNTEKEARKKFVCSIQSYGERYTEKTITNSDSDYLLRNLLVHTVFFVAPLAAEQKHKVEAQD
jgi:hypothetical protein